MRLSRLLPVLVVLAACAAWGVAHGAQRAGVGLVATSPGGELSGGAGLEGTWAVARSAWWIRGGLAWASVDRDAGAVLPPGEARLLRASASLLRELGGRAGGFRFEAGGGVDLWDGSGREVRVSDPALGIRSRDTLDRAVGAHLEAGALRDLGARATLSLALGWLLADLDGEQRFTISGVEGRPSHVAYDLGGPFAGVRVLFRLGAR